VMSRRKVLAGRKRGLRLFPVHDHGSARSDGGKALLEGVRATGGLQTDVGAVATSEVPNARHGIGLFRIDGHGGAHTHGRFTAYGEGSTAITSRPRKVYVSALPRPMGPRPKMARVRMAGCAMRVEV